MNGSASSPSPSAASPPPAELAPSPQSPQANARKRKRAGGSDVVRPSLEERKAAAKDPSKYINKQRTLILCTRGISNRDRHLMSDLRDLLPLSKKDSKLDAKDKLHVVNEVAELNNCNNCVFFEARKKKDLYLWVARCPNGPSAKFHVENVHTMAEVKLSGNCLKGSRPLLSFDPAFDSAPHLSLLKQLFVQAFGTPKGHPKAKPFIDHVFSFFIADNRVWFRNYQIVYDAEQKDTALTASQLMSNPSAARGALPKGKDPVLVEIGPRFVLNPIRIFEGSFSGATLWENPSYVSPSQVRSAAKRQQSGQYVRRVKARQDREQREKEVGVGDLPGVDMKDVFQ